MSECILCGKQTGFFDKRICEGYVCKDCFSRLPAFLDVQSMGTEKLRYLREQNEKKRKLFFPAVSFGSLFVDNIHRMFCISPKSRNDEPLVLSDIYTVAETEEIALYCKNPQCTGSGRNIHITCDAELFVRTHDLQFRTIIVRNEKCSYKMIDGNKVEWNESGRVAMFRSMFNQMIADENNAMLKEIYAVRNQKRIVWAEGVLMLKSLYTEDELRQHYDFLKQILEQQVHPTAKYYLTILEQAFHVLQEHLKSKESA